MKTLKNRWETELDNAVPALSEELKNAPIVILDEATAYTDPENEALIQKA